MGRQRAAAIEHERRLKAIEAERRRRILIALQEQQRLIEQQAAEQERKEREYAQTLYEYQRRRNARRPRETIVRGRDGRLYRYIVNDADADADTDDDDEILDYIYQEPATVRARSVENVPVVSIPVHQVTSDASSRSSAAALNKEV